MKKYYVSPSSVFPDEMARAADWTATRLVGPTPPFSFSYGGKTHPGFLPAWRRRDIRTRLDARRTQHVVRFTDPRTGLVVRLVAITYRDFPVVEWTVYLKNTGRKNTPIIEKLQAIDLQFDHAELAKAGRPDELRLHYHIGSPTKPEDYRPLNVALAPGSVKTIATSGGRPCNAHMPFFNLEWSGAGLIMAVGWGGQWAAKFGRDKQGNLRLAAGQELTHFTLHPGEEVRTPLIALLFYQGDRFRAQNIWRRWMLAHNLPRPAGKLPAPMLHGGAWVYFAPWGTSNAQSIKVFIDTYEARKIPIDTWWIDAGWYDCDASLQDIGYSVWNRTGTWEPDQLRFPNGVREVNDHAHKKGLKTILWFEPERVWRPGTWLAEKHPEWLLKTPHWPDKNTLLLNLGNPAARRWLINHVSGLLKRERVDIYREDFNMDPLAFWRANDTRDRQGITEIRHIMGHLAFWDELRRRHPNLLIDICASGGKRNELEGLRRAVPLWRSDFTPGLGVSENPFIRLDANQCISHGIALWIPYYGSGMSATDPYRFYSLMCPSIVFDFDPRREDIDFELWHRLLKQFRRVAKYFYGDYYPLTGYSLDSDVWMAWQFDCPEIGEGMVQAFRRKDSPDETVRFTLRGLQAEKLYTMTNIDGPEVQRQPGRVLMKQGLTIKMPKRPDATIIIYKRERQV